MTSALVASMQKVPWKDVSRYGIIECKVGGGYEMKDMVEKPSREILIEIPLSESNKL